MPQFESASTRLRLLRMRIAGACARSSAIASRRKARSSYQPRTNDPSSGIGESPKTASFRLCFGPFLAAGLERRRHRAPQPFGNAFAEKNSDLSARRIGVEWSPTDLPASRYTTSPGAKTFPSWIQDLSDRRYEFVSWCLPSGDT